MIFTSLVQELRDDLSHPIGLIQFGAIGFAVGIGLQKIGSNMISGLMLLLRKPIRQGDVITFEKSFAGSRWGWINDIGLMYVKVATRG